MIVRFPYGKSETEVNLPDERLLAVVKLSKIRGIATEFQQLKKSLNNPIGSENLWKLASKERKVCIIISDYTRAMPNRKVIPPILGELERGGCRMHNIYILVAYGLHSPASSKEVKRSLGKSVTEKVRVIEHNAEDESQLAYLGETAFDTKLWVNKLLVDCDLIIGTGLIEPHFFAGYSGGRKAVLPGVAGRESIFQNHSFAMIEHPKARYGMLDENPIHQDMVEAAKLAGLDYIVNVVVEGDRVVKAFSGNPYQAHYEGIKFLNKWVKIGIPSKAEIVIVSNGGYPLDRDLYQTVKGIATGELCVKKNGVIIILSECLDGIGKGHKSFYRIMAEAESPNEVLQKIRREEPIKDQWQAQILARILKIASVVVVTKNIKHSLIEDMQMIPSSNVEKALNLAYGLTNERSKVTAVLDGPYSIPCPKDFFRAWI